MQDVVHVKQNFLTKSVSRALSNYKCTSVSELSHRITNDFVYKTTSNWQGKVNSHYFLRISIPLYSSLT